MHWTPDDWRSVIVSDKSTFHVLKRKIQCKRWCLEKEKLLSECIQQSNTGDGGKVGIWKRTSEFGTTATKIYTETMDGKFYCDVLQHQLKPSIAQMPKKDQILFSTRAPSQAHIKHCERKNRQFKVGCNRPDSNKARFKSNRDLMVYFK